MKLTHPSLFLGTKRCKLWAEEETTNEASSGRAPDWNMLEPKTRWIGRHLSKPCVRCPCAMLGKSKSRAGEEESARTNRFVHEGWEQFI